MQRLLSGLTLLLFFLACGERIPEGVIPRKQLPDVLADMHLIDGMLSQLPVDSARQYREAYYEAIFSRYGIDSSIFERSIRFYASRPHLLNEAYTAAEKQLEEMHQQQQKAVEAQYMVRLRADSALTARRADSLRRVARDSLDFRRRRYLLFLSAPDSLYGKPDPVNPEKLHDRLLEDIGLKPIMPASPVPQAPVPSAPPEPSASPSTGDRPRPVLRPGQHMN